MTSMDRLLLLLLVNGKPNFYYSHVLLLFPSCDFIWSRPDQFSSVLSFGHRCLGLFSPARGWPMILFCFGILLVPCRLRLSFSHGLSATAGLHLLFLELIHRSGCRSRFVLRPTHCRLRCSFIFLMLVGRVPMPSTPIFFSRP
jgi:hypothetical protein